MVATEFDDSIHKSFSGCTIHNHHLTVDHQINTILWLVGRTPELNLH